jgi:hypothetical protein
MAGRERIRAAGRWPVRRTRTRLPVPSGVVGVPAAGDRLLTPCPGAAHVSSVLTLGLQLLMRQVEDLAREKGFINARTAHKINARGELVIALLIPPRTPGEWDEKPSVRELKRASRMAR